MTSRVTISLDKLLMLKAKARGFSFRSKQPAGSLLSGRHASRLRGRGLSFEELRAYHPGDDIRLMDWKATARLRSPQIRVYNEERDRPLLLLVDQRSTMFFGSQVAMKSVVAAEVAALSGWKALEGGDRVGSIVFNEQRIEETRPHRSQSRLLQVFHQLVSFNQELTKPKLPVGTIGINSVLKRAATVAKHDHLIILISDLIGIDNETQQLASQLAAHNDVLIAVVYDPLGITLSGDSDMVAEQQGKTWKIPKGGRFSEDFKSVFEEQFVHWQRIFQSLKIPLFPITTARPAIDQIRSRLGEPSRPA
ncbi:DUF58 domain-containing protein [Thalassoglobus sp.]|uniref:DUF58 domain-containing protein n=1 Tax=Thalassoglobus sp. TaxID=2795869 RepID=UPI003AA908C7